MKYGTWKREPHKCRNAEERTILRKKERHARTPHQVPVGRAPHGESQRENPDEKAVHPRGLQGRSDPRYSPRWVPFLISGRITEHGNTFTKVYGYFLEQLTKRATFWCGVKWTQQELQVPIRGSEMSIFATNFQMSSFCSKVGSIYLKFVIEKVEIRTTKKSANNTCRVTLA